MIIILGPALKTGRNGHSCALMTSLNETSLTYERILVAAGGNGVTSVELLNLDQYEASTSAGWVFGPSLPVDTYISTMTQVEDGVILVGGGRPGGLQSLYKLTPGADNWQLLETSLKEPRSAHVSFLVPDELVNCHY